MKSTFQEFKQVMKQMRKKTPNLLLSTIDVSVHYYYNTVMVANGYNLTKLDIFYV